MAASRSRGIRGGDERQPRTRARDHPAACRARPPARLRHARRLRHRRPDGPHAGGRRRHARTPRSRAAARNARAEQADLQRLLGDGQTRRGVGLGPPDRARCAPRSTTSTSLPCAPTSKPSGCCATASSTRRTASTASPSPSAPTSVAYHPDARVFEVAQRRRLRARPLHPRPLHARLEARRRVDEPADLAVRAARHAHGRRQQPQRARSPRPASRRCSPTTRRTPSSTSSGTRCTACSRG